jgi:hypothetical protein
VPRNDAEGPGTLARTGARTRSDKQKSPENIERPIAEQVPVYLIRLRSTRSGNDIRKLRAILKTLLRRFGFRCLSVIEEARS